jgi:hypothetical protein
MTRAVPTFRALLLIALALLPALAAAQTPARRAIDVAGRVLDSRTETPLPNALIDVPDLGRRVLTDTAGRFELRGIRPGSHRWTISRMGYSSWEEDVEADDGDTFTIRLLARPLLLEGITVISSQFRQRREAAGVAVRALEREEIVQSAGTNAFDVVTSRTGLVPMACPQNRTEQDCAYVRGELMPIRIFIDDQPQTGGLEVLRTYVPGDLYLVESYSGGAMIRVYTTWYAQQVARGKMLGSLSF